MKRPGEHRLSGGILLCCLCIIILAKCVTPYEPAGVTSSEGLLVIEAYIIAPTGSSIKISKTRGLQEDTRYEKVSNANITIINDNGDVIAAAEENNAGEYTINDPIEFLPNTKYALNVVIGNEHFQSSFEEPFITPDIDELGWVSKNGGHEVDILLDTHDPQQKTEYYLWRYEEDWEYTAQFDTAERWDPDTRRVIPNTYTDNVYYCWDNSHSNSFILGDAKTLQEGVFKDKVIASLKAGDTRFSHLYSILVKQYGISYEAYKYYGNLQKNTNETGGLFAPMPTEMDGNIRNLTNPKEPVIGYALISTEASKRMYIYRQDVPNMTSPLSAECMLEPTPEDGITSPQIGYERGWGLYFDSQYRQLKCVDCRKLGGSKKKPHFWPTTHL